MRRWKVTGAFTRPKGIFLNSESSKGCEGCLLSGRRLQLHLPISGGQVERREETGRHQEVQRNVDPWQGKLIQLRDGIQLPVVNAKSHPTIFLLHKHYRTCLWTLGGLDDRLLEHLGNMVTEQGSTCNDIKTYPLSRSKPIKLRSSLSKRSRYTLLTSDYKEIFNKGSRCGYTMDYSTH